MAPVLSKSCGKREEEAKEIHFLTVRGLRCGSAQQKLVVGACGVEERPRARVLGETLARRRVKI
jgi:hypothetical protein